MKRRTYILIIVPCSLVALTASLSRAEPQTSTPGSGTESRLAQASTVASAETTQVALLSARINEIVDLLTKPTTNSTGSVCYNNATEEAILHQWLRAKDQEATRLQTEGRLREALEVREEMVWKGLKAPAGMTPPISVYKFQYMEKLHGGYVQCSLQAEASQFRAALNNLNKLRPAPPGAPTVKAGATAASRPAPPSNLRIVVAQ